MLKGHILDLEREKFAEALTVIEYLTGGERMYMDLYDRAVAECNDRIAELRQPAYEFVDIKAVDIRLFMLQTEQKLGAVAELELKSERSMRGALDAVAVSASCLPVPSSAASIPSKM